MFLKVLRRDFLRHVAFALAIAGSAAPVVSPAQDTDLGIARAGQLEPSTISIPPFEATGGAAFADNVLADTIQRDLVLSGFFRAPANPSFAADVQAMDVRDNTVHYAEWYRAGVSYVVKGKYKVVNNKIQAEVRAYDTTGGKYIFGKLYSDYPKENPRRLSHYIANDIQKKITGVPGVAHTQMLMIGEAGSNGAGGVAKEVFLMDADGNNRIRLTNDKNLAATPAWGARGTECYFTTYKDYNPDMMGLIFSTNQKWFISRRSGFNISPSWNERSQTIALTLSRDGNSEIYTMDRAGKGMKRLTFSRSIDSSPCWSPDGQQIAFTSDRTGGPQVHIMSAGGENVRRLTHNTNYNDGASWSPRGDLIAYSSRVNGVFQICVIRPDGTDFRQLTSAPYNCEDPSFAPNGYILAYSSEQTGKKQINTMFIDGRPLAQLTSGSAYYSPAWSPMFESGE